MKSTGKAQAPAAARFDEAMTRLHAHASTRVRDGLARYAIPAANALGVPMRDIQTIAKQLGPDHALATALWRSGIYEARLLSAYVDDPAAVTAAQMDRCCRQFDSWALCDTLCFALWDRSPHAWSKVLVWTGDEAEFVKRAGFALLASLALHDRGKAGIRFSDGLLLIEREAGDPRNYVKKAVSWALKAIGRRDDTPLGASARKLALRLSCSDDATARWVGRDALKQFGRTA